MTSGSSVCLIFSYIRDGISLIHSNYNRYFYQLVSSFLLSGKQLGLSHSYLNNGEYAKNNIPKINFKSKT